MNIFQIDSEIMNCVDPETGEIVNFEKLEELQLERDQKVENIALWIKNLRYEAECLKAEKDALAQREKTAKRKIEDLEDYLGYVLSGQKFETPKVKISFRKSTVVGIQNEALLPAEYIEIKVERSPNKTAIRTALKAKMKVPGAILIEKANIQIK